MHHLWAADSANRHVISPELFTKRTVQTVPEPVYGQRLRLFARPIRPQPAMYVPNCQNLDHTPFLDRHDSQSQNGMPQSMQHWLTSYVIVSGHTPSPAPNALSNSEHQQALIYPQRNCGKLNVEHQSRLTIESNSSSSTKPALPTASPMAMPGPIPATTPLVRQNNDGSRWISFRYSKNRVQTEYSIRCDVELINTSALPQEFKLENCVYPRACGLKESYKGNRFAYESHCNELAWALVELNPCLRGNRGLIQRAVDSWRNSNQDLGLRSRRVRRQMRLALEPEV